MIARYHDISKETTGFLDKFDGLSYTEKLNFLAILFEQMQNGQINSENSADAFAVDDNGGNIFYPADAGLPDGSGVGHSILAQLRKYESGAKVNARG